MRIKPDGSGSRGLLNGRVSERQARPGSTGCASRSCPRTGRLIAVVSDGPDPLQSDIVLIQFYDTTTKKLTNAEPPRVGGARPPGPGLATGRQGPAPYVQERPRRDARRAADLPLRPENEEDGAAHRPRLHRPRLVARRPVHRRDEDRTRSGPTSSSSTRDRHGGPPGHRRRPLLLARSGRRPATPSRSSTSTARSSTSRWSCSTARPAAGPSARRST